MSVSRIRLTAVSWPGLTPARCLMAGSLFSVLAVSSLLTGCNSNKGGTEVANNPSSTTTTGGAPTGEEIPIGEYGGLTGKTADFGQTTHEGIMLAVEEINAAGGIKGKKLKLFTEDDESTKEKVRSVVTKLITQSKAVAILGEVASSRSIAAAPVCEQYKTPMISPSSTNPAVTVKEDGTVRDFIFRVCYIDPFQGSGMATYMHDKRKVSKVAVFRNTKEDYSKGLADFFAKTFKAKGGTVTTDISYSTGDTDFRAQLTAIKGTNPQAVFVPGYYNEVGLIVKQAREIGLNVPFAGGDGWDGATLITVGGKALEGCYFMNHFSANSQDTRAKAFVDAYQKKYSKVPNALAAVGYDAAKLLAEAMKQSKSLGGEDLKTAISQSKNFPGVTGDITINAQHNAVKPAVVLEFKGGKETVVDTIKPE